MGKETDMKKRIFAPVAAAVALVAALALSACGASPAASDQGSAGSSSADAGGEITTLTVGFDQAYPPYGYVGDDGEFTGLDLELAAEVAKRNDWELKLEPIDWDAKDTLLNSGAITCIWNGFTMEGREDDYTFSDPYMLNAQVVVVRADSGIESFEDLAGKTVIIQVDSAAEEVLNGDMADLTATFASLETIGDYNTAFMQLESGAVDAVACDLSIAQYQMAGKDTYKQLDEQLSTEHYAVGFKKGDTALAEKVTETLKEMDEDGFVEELCDKYADDGVSYDNWLIK
ncbi:transporter substrate-binding domain-containing protein [Collinsella tanakaei]|uniref:transporter substrate-binding domain-containing protein n=1 Tax=Collinsella tanakaei TaxID=626935 RepID=UPI0039F4AAD0